MSFPRLTDDMTDAQVAQVGQVLAELKNHEGWGVFEQLLKGTYQRIAIVGLKDETTDPWFYRGQLHAIEMIEAAISNFIQAFEESHKTKTAERQAQRIVAGGGGDIAS